MPARRREFNVSTRIANARECAAYIGVGDSKFLEMRKSGAFPVAPVPYGEYFDLHRVDEWLDNIGGRGGAADTAVATDPWEGAAHA